MKNLATLSLTLALLWVRTASAQPEFPHPERIRYDGQCLTIDGKDTFIFSGAFHYFRCPKPLWADRFAKIKEAGFNTVETYVAWNWHEREMPASPEDFSKVDMTDLVDWMKMAHAHGLYTIIRPGPYICAEWCDGGFPTWLNLKRPKDYQGNWMRSDDPEFLKWSRHWMDACVPAIAAEQITRKKPGEPGVILFQIENEYDLIQGFSDDQRTRHLKSLYADARRNGIDVPIFTCWTRQVRNSGDPDLKNVFDSANSYVRWNLLGTADQVRRTKESQPNAPGMIAELQGGWFAQVGGQLSEQQDGVTAEQCNGITLMAMANGATILNYYMLFGGTNVGDWAARTQPTTYDYFAPIREHGGIGAKYLKVKAIGQMLHELGEKLARTERLNTQAEGFATDSWGDARRSKDGTTFVFLWNRSRSEPISGVGTVTVTGEAPLRVAYELAPFDFKVLVLAPGKADSAEGVWYPKPLPQINRPTTPAPVDVRTARFAAGSRVGDWKDVSPGQSLLDAGIFDSRHVLYRSMFTLTAAQAGKFRTLQLHQSAGDPVRIRVNGALLPPGHTGNLAEIKVGENELLMLYENLGYPNFGPGVEHIPGVTAAALTWSPVQNQVLSDWRVSLVESREPTTQVATDFDDQAWAAFVLNDQTAVSLTQPVQPGAEDPLAAGKILFGRNNARAVFRTNLNLTREMIDSGLTQLIFDRIDDSGTVYINGERAGRVNSFERPLVIDAKQLLKPGKNSIAVVVLNRSGQGGLTRPVRLVSSNVESLPLHLQLADRLEAPTDAWATVSLPHEADPASNLINWYEFEFTLPAMRRDVWVPWMARIAASGNGMIWLNGHHLGRYFDVGPQRDFYLPECWLNFGQTNRLRLGLRPTGNRTGVQSVVVMPYPDAAESR